VFSRLAHSIHPEVIQENMVFALETFWPATDGCRRQESKSRWWLTKDGAEIITRFPAEELLVAGKRYHTRVVRCRPRARRSPT